MVSFASYASSVGLDESEGSLPVVPLGVFPEFHGGASFREIGVGDFDDDLEAGEIVFQVDALVEAGGDKDGRVVGTVDLEEGRPVEAPFGCDESPSVRLREARRDAVDLRV